MDPEVDSISQMTVDQLAQILSYVDIKQRMSSCSLVSSSWRTAAARATTSIQHSLKRGQSPTPFQDWLRSHTAEVQVSSLVVEGAYRPLVSNTQLSLPLVHLQSLRSLKLVDQA